MVNMSFYFFYQNTLIDFMVALFIGCKWKIQVPASIAFAAISEF